MRISSRDPEPPPPAYVRGSGGMFLDMTIHDFDMARFVTGAEVVEVFARGAVRIDPAFADAGDVDTALVTLVHANGCLTAIDNSRRARYGYDQRVEVFGSAGWPRRRTRSRTPASCTTAAGPRAPTLPHLFLERYVPSYVRAWEAFVAAVATGAPPPVTATDARAPLVIGLAAWRSLREGRPVSPVEAAPREAPPHRRVAGSSAPTSSHVFARGGADVRRAVARRARPDRRRRRRCAEVGRPRRTRSSTPRSSNAFGRRCPATGGGVGGVRRRHPPRRRRGQRRAARMWCSSPRTGCSTGRRRRRAEDAPPNPGKPYGLLKPASELVVRRARPARHDRSHRRRPGRASRASDAVARAGCAASATSSPSLVDALRRRRAVHGLGGPS